MNLQRFSDYAPLVLRFGLAFLFLWFGLSQLTHPSDWVSWVPANATALTGMNAQTIVLLNGVFETILGGALIIGFYTRLSAFLLSLHLFFLAYEIGYNDIGVRDFALAACTLALALAAPDPYTLDKRMDRG